MKDRPAGLLMLERWIEPAVRHMGPEFTTHQYIEKLREVYPADYAHDLALCTLEQGFPQSLAVLHKAIVNQLRRSDLVEVIGTRKSRDIRRNKHRTLVWRRLGQRRPSRRPREPARGGASRPKGSGPALQPSSIMSGAELRAARTALGWTRTKLARQAGVSLAAVSRWERGERRMTWSSAQVIRKVLQATEPDRELVGHKVESSSVERRQQEPA